MNNYINYERIAGQCDADELKEIFKSIITKGQVILFYNERTEMIRHQIPKSNNFDIEIVIHYVMVLGKENVGLESEKRVL